MTRAGRIAKIAAQSAGGEKDGRLPSLLSGNRGTAAPVLPTGNP